MNAFQQIAVSTYAVNKLGVIAEDMGGYLRVVQNLGGPYAGVDVFIHPNVPMGGTLAHKLCLTSLDEVDAFAASIRDKASVAA